MYATMIACAFASCSKDDVIDNGTDPVAKGDASLNFKIEAKQTKATADEEKTISELKVFVFDKVSTDATRKVIASAYTDSYNSAEGVTISSLPTGAAVYCEAIANMGNVTFSELSANAITVTASAGLNGSKLPMAGEATTDVLVAGANNEVTIPMYRKVARVELTAVKLGMGNQDAYTSGKASFQFQGSYIGNAANTATLAGAASQVETWFSGVSLTGNTLVDYLKSEPVTPLATAEQNFTSATSTEIYQDVAIETAVYYVLPNPVSDNSTTLILKGAFGIENGVKKADGSTVTVAATPGYYKIKVGEDGLPAGTTAMGVVANKSYKIIAIVAGEGDGTTDGGKKATLLVKTTVQNWDELTQTSVVK